MTTPNEVHISSLVIQATPGAARTVERGLATIEGIEIVHTDTDMEKIIALLESNSTKYIREKIEEIERVAGVLCAALVYHHSESPHSLNEVLL